MIGVLRVDACCVVTLQDAPTYRKVHQESVNSGIIRQLERCMCAQRATTCNMARHDTRSPARVFWERVDREKTLLGWNDSELARQSGVNRSTYGRLKDLKTSPLPDTVRKLADAVGIARTEAFHLAGLLHAETPTEPHLVTDIGDDEETEQLLAQLPPARRALLERVLQQERERLERLHRQAQKEVEEARIGFIELVRSALKGDENDD